MLGNLILKIRQDKNISKTQLARETNMNIGHITHIEKSERTPSHKALKKISKTLDVPYQQLSYAYDKILTDEQKSYNIINHINYNSIIAINSLDDLIFCPSNYGTASFSLKINDASMEPILLKGSYAFIEQSAPLSNKDIGLFYYNNQFYIRRFIIKKDSIILRADNKNFEEFNISSSENFYIIGRILGTNTDY